VTTKITVSCTRGRFVEVDAHVYGEWAAHPGVDGDDLSERLDWWVVSHVPTGRCIVSAVGCLNDDEAKQLASAMGERLPRRLIPDIPRDESFIELPLDVKRQIRSVIYDVRGEVLV
jgi:hypothetical protein